MWPNYQAHPDRFKSNVAKFTLILFFNLVIYSDVKANEWHYYGDFRYDYLVRNSNQENIDDLWRTRFRLGLKQTDVSKGAWEIRLASNYLSIGDNSAIELSLSYPLAQQADKRFTTLDRFYWQKQGQNWHIRLGRFTHQNVLKGSAGLSLNSKNTIATVVDWTDGLELNYSLANHWEMQFLLQYEAASRPSSTRRAPLDFADNGSRASYHFQLERLTPHETVMQKSFGLNYYPNALPSRSPDMDFNNRVAYRTVNSRIVFGWPIKYGKWLLGAGLGYAIDRPNAHLSKLVTQASDSQPKSDKLSFQSIIGWQDFIPDHKLEFTYSKTSDAWLISPNFPANARVKVLTYLWMKKSYLVEITALKVKTLIPYTQEKRNSDTNLMLFRLHFSF